MAAIETHLLRVGGGGGDGVFIFHLEGVPRTDGDAKPISIAFFFIHGNEAEAHSLLLSFTKIREISERPPGLAYYRNITDAPWSGPGLPVWTIGQRYLDVNLVCEAGSS